MEICKGLGDWLACSKCPAICTKYCPIEKENTVEELRKRIRTLDKNADRDIDFFDGPGCLLD